MGGIDGILRRAVQADFKLGLDRSLECFTLAHEWLRAEHIEDAGKGDIVPIDVLQNLVEVFNQVFDVARLTSTDRARLVTRLSLSLRRCCPILLVLQTWHSITLWFRCHRLVLL